MINTRLFATVLEHDFVKASSGEFSKTQQINYSAVLAGFDLLQMANDCDEYISTKNHQSDILSNEPPLKCPSSGGGGIYIRSFFSSCFFIYFFVCLFTYFNFYPFFSLLY